MGTENRQASCERITENVCAVSFRLFLCSQTHTHFHDVTHGTHIFHFSTNTLPGCPSSLQSDTHISMTSHTAHTFSIFLQIRCRAVPARCRPSTKHLMLMPIFGYRFHFAVKERCCCCCCWFILMQQTHTFPWRHCVCTRFPLGARKTPVNRRTEEHATALLLHSDLSLRTCGMHCFVLISICAYYFVFLFSANSVLSDKNFKSEYKVHSVRPSVVFVFEKCRSYK